jgi:hypothetical protein
VTSNTNPKESSLKKRVIIPSGDGHGKRGFLHAQSWMPFVFITEPAAIKTTRE